MAYGKRSDVLKDFLDRSRVFPAKTTFFCYFCENVYPPTNIGLLDKVDRALEAEIGQERGFIIETQPRPQ